MGVVKTDAALKAKFIAGLPKSGAWPNFRSGLYSTQAHMSVKPLRDTIIEEAQGQKTLLSSAAKIPYGANAVSFSPGGVPSGPCHQSGNTGH